MKVGDNRQKRTKSVAASQYHIHIVQWTSVDIELIFCNLYKKWVLVFQKQKLKNPDIFERLEQSSSKACSKKIKS